MSVEHASDHGAIEPHAPGHEPIEHEKPEDWGWHADLGKPARIAAWISVVVLLLGTTATHYNESGTGALLIIAGLMVVGLLWDARKRRTSWRR